MLNMRPRRADVPLAEKVAFLARREAYAHAPASVEMIQTHMSWVFLADGYAYKLKKPVRYDFLDFGSVAARRLNCGRELELNRRLAGNGQHFIQLNWQVERHQVGVVRLQPADRFPGTDQ